MTSCYVPWEEAEEAHLRSAGAAGGAPAIASADASSSQAALRGLFMVFSSSLLFSTSNFFIFLVARVGGSFSIPPAQTLCVRFFFQFALSVLATALLRRGRLRDRGVWMGKPRNAGKLLARAVFGVGGLGCWVWLLSNASLSDAAGITFLNIPLTAIFARAYLKEPYTRIDALTGALGLLGVVLVAQPSSLFGATSGVAVAPMSATAVAVGLCGACFSACAFLSIRTIGPDEDVLVVTLAFAALGCLLAPALLLATDGGWRAVSDPAQAWLLVGVGCTGFLGQLLLNAGMGMAPAGPAAVMRYLDLVNALWMQSLILNDVPNALKWAGCLCVLSSVVSTLHKQQLKARAEKVKAAAAATAADSHADPSGS